MDGNKTQSQVLIKALEHAWAYALLFEFKRFLVLTVPDDEYGEDMKLMIGWWPNDFLVRVKAVRGDKYGEINPAMSFYLGYLTMYSSTFALAGRVRFCTRKE